MNAEFEIQLIEALEALDRGETIEAILKRYPDIAADLRPMLITTTALPALRMQPSEAQKMKSRQAFLKQGAALRQTAQRRSRLGFVPRAATLFAAFSLTLAVLGGGAVAASGSALPGDPLYGLKRAVENTRLALSDAAGRAALQTQFDAQRRAEATALLDAGREVDVQFTGQIESLQPDAWVVGGLVVRVDAHTQISGQPQLDQLAEVRGVTGRAGLRALFITLDPASTPMPLTPEPTPDKTPTPTPTPTPNPIVTPEPTEPRPTRQPPTPTPAPTQPPARIEFSGSVNSQTTDRWVIDGVTIAIDARTVFKGNIGVGQRVKVQALRYANGQLLAIEIELLNDDSGDNGNTNDNANADDGPNDNSNSDQNDNHDNDNDNQNGNHDDDDNNNDHNSNNSNNK